MGKFTTPVPPELLGHKAEVTQALAAGRSLNFILRVSDGLAGVDTYAEHLAILNRRHKVWWAKWGMGIGHWAADVANWQIANGIPTRLYLLFANDMRYVANLGRVIAGGPKERFEAPEPSLVPAYYRTMSCGVWFLVTSLQANTKPPRLVKYLDPSEPPNFFGQRGLFYVTPAPP